ncbi:MAG: U32 family peptidase [Clostridia bacterium]|nr:U32 family peptidase [Clostridia bacterium]
MLIANGKRVHAAINIYAKDETYDDIIEQAKILGELGVDGIIMSDGGVIDAVKKVAPNTPIHISTQANTISYHSANFWYKNGAKRVILGREMTKEEIKTLIQNKPKDLEVEIFAHGALCFGYSGRCFLSEFLAGRSGNLGDCAQSCRWAFNVYVEETNKPGNLMPVEYDEKGTYIFSSKDLCLIKEIPEIIEMGVDSIKIEGRLKTEYYLASVINAYRNAIDDYYKDPKNYDFNKYLKELEKTKTRGLTTFYFNDRNNQDIQDYGGHQYNNNFEFGGKVIEDRKDRILIEIRNKLSLGDTLELIVPGKIKPVIFKIENLWNDETEEEIQTVNPGKAEQKVILNKPDVNFEIGEDWILRRMK